MDLAMMEKLGHHHRVVLLGGNLDRPGGVKIGARIVERLRRKPGRKHDRGDNECGKNFSSLTQAKCRVGCHCWLVQQCWNHGWASQPWHPTA